MCVGEAYIWRQASVVIGIHDRVSHAASSRVQPEPQSRLIQEMRLMQVHYSLAQMKYLSLQNFL